MENSRLLNLVVTNVPVADFLKLRTAAGRMPSGERSDIYRSAQEAKITLHGAPEKTINPIMIVARAFASKVNLDEYLNARKNYVGKTIEELNDWCQNDPSPILAIEGILHDKTLLEAESAMIQTIVQVLAEHHKK